MDSQWAVLFVFICQVIVSFGMNTALEKGSTHNIPRQQQETRSTAIQNYQQLFLLPTYRQSALLNSNQPPNSNNHHSIGEHYGNGSLQYSNYVPQELPQQRAFMHSQQTTIEQEITPQSTPISTFSPEITIKTMQSPQHLPPNSPQTIPQSQQQSQKYSPQIPAQKFTPSSGITEKSYAGTALQIMANLYHMNIFMGEFHKVVGDLKADEYGLGKDFLKNLFALGHEILELFYEILGGKDRSDVLKRYQDLLPMTLMMMKKFEHLSKVMTPKYHEENMEEAYDIIKDILATTKAAQELYSLGDLEPIPQHLSLNSPNTFNYNYKDQLPKPTYSALAESYLDKLRHPPKRTL